MNRNRAVRLTKKRLKKTLDGKMLEEKALEKMLDGKMFQEKTFDEKTLPH